MNTQNNPYIKISAGIIAVAIVFLGYYLYSKNAPTLSFDTGVVVNWGIDIPSKYELDEHINKNPLYTDSENRFSFNYPKEFTAGNFRDDAGATILFQKQGEKAGFQVRISYFDEPGKNITPERIQSEVGDIVIISPVEVVYDEQVIGLAFTSQNESVGSTREVWIARAGYLYQLS